MMANQALECALAMVGVLMIITGKFPGASYNGWVRTGGMVLLLPFPITQLTWYGIEFTHAQNYRPFNPARWQWVLEWVEIALIGGCFVLGTLIALVGGADPERAALG